MIIKDVSKEKNLDSALKKYKYKVQKVKQIEKLREKQHYVKPSVVKRNQKLRAIHKQQVRNSQNN